MTGQDAPRCAWQVLPREPGKTRRSMVRQTLRRIIRIGGQRRSGMAGLEQGPNAIEKLAAAAAAVDKGLRHAVPCSPEFETRRKCCRGEAGRATVPPTSS